MKLYYIDDTMFQNSAFSRKIRDRFIQLLHRENGKMVCISTAHQNLKELQDFIDRESFNRYILLSPAVFDIEGWRGNLHDLFLEVEGFEKKQAYSGSCLIYDTEKKSCERIYLELALQHTYDEFYEIERELEELIFSRLHQKNKKKSFH